MDKEVFTMKELMEKRSPLIVVLQIKCGENTTLQYTIGCKDVSIEEMKKELREDVGRAFGPTAVVSFPVVYKKEETTDKKVKFIYKKIE